MRLSTDTQRGGVSGQQLITARQGHIHTWGHSGGLLCGLWEGRRTHLLPHTELTCGKHSFSGQSLVVDDGELRQLDVLHPSDGTCITSSLPVELNVISGVSVCGGRRTGADRSADPLMDMARSPVDEDKLLMIDR